MTRVAATHSLTQFYYKQRTLTNKVDTNTTKISVNINVILSCGVQLSKHINTPRISFINNSFIKGNLRISHLYFPSLHKV